MREHPHPRTNSDREPGTRLAASAGGKQHTDSTAVLAAVRALNSLESVGESMRAALNDLAKEDQEWLLAYLVPDWFDRYVHRFEMTRFPKQESKQQALRRQVGEDVAQLLDCVDLPEDSLRSGPIALCHTAPTGLYSALRACTDRGTMA